jgi:cytochrome c oxidase subunit 2
MSRRGTELAFRVELPQRSAGATVVSLQPPDGMLTIASTPHQVCVIVIRSRAHELARDRQLPAHGALLLIACDKLVALHVDDKIDHAEPQLPPTDSAVPIRLLTTSNDVLHSWAVPAFWIKQDANPGQLHETWAKVDRPGVYFGQCSELCGVKHAYMPIAVHVVNPTFGPLPVGHQPDEPVSQPPLACYGHRDIS